MEQRLRSFLLFLMFSLSASSIWGQRLIQGTVTDVQAVPLPFVNILINDSRTRGVSTDIDGKFQIEVTDSVYALTFSYVGYETRRISISGITRPLTVRMKPAAYGIEEVVVIAGENPADRIIRRAVDNRKRNDPENLDAYRCRTYNKVVFSFLPDEARFRDFFAERDSSKKSDQTYRDNVQRLIDQSREQHLFMMESVTQRSYRKPGQAREKVLHNRVAGFKEAPFAALANDVQPFAFYDEQLALLNKSFLNPVSRGSTRNYFFHLRDTLFQGRDTIFIIEFHPRKGKNFEGLTGVLYIHSNGYAVQNVIAEPADTGFIHLRIEQQYALVENRQWFPEQLNFVIQARKYPTAFLGTRVYGKSYIDSISLAPSAEERLFRREEQITFDTEAHNRSDSVWQLLRKEALDTLERNTYRSLDSLGEALNLDRRLQQLGALATGRWPLGLVDLSVPDVIAFNEFESVRLGAGFYTNDRLSRHFSLGAYGGYGFRDKAWKYGASLELNMEASSETTLKFFYQQDIREPAVPGFGLSRPLISRRLLARRMDQVEEYGLQFGSRPLKYLTVQAGLRRQDIRPFGDYRYNPVQDPSENPPYAFAEAALGLRYAYGENVVPFLGSRLAQPTDFPVLEAHYLRGLTTFGGAFAYQQVLFSIDHSFALKGLGKTNYRMETGWLDRPAPLAKLFNSSGFGRDFQFLTIGHAFQTMDRYEFLSDRFLHLFFKHDFGTLLFKSGTFKPNLSLVNNLALGTLQHPEYHEGLDFSTLEKGYFESGIVAENLVRINYLNLMYLGIGAGAYYRYGPYALPSFRDNWAFRLALTFSY